MSDSALRIAVDATSVLNRISKAMPELEIQLVVGILLERIENVMQAEGYYE